ncbi:MAG: DUF1598 domain-containing protein [Candidatus Eisenbacteria bacterium]|nr:DUF1598 domain-containing protein [Candidatus Eisenbacteria bacterium]
MPRARSMASLAMMMFVVSILTMSFSPSAKCNPPVGRAVSLSVLQQELAKLQPGQPIPEEIYTLAGLTRLDGYVLDDRMTPNDIVLIGEAGPGSPLLIDHLAAALQNVWLVHAEQMDDTIYYSDPGCSIDPVAEVLARLQEIQESLDQADPETAIQEWCAICEREQLVSVMGVPPDCHFAGIMVQADYDMKRIVDGSDTLGIPGFESLSDMEIRELEAAVARGDRPSGSISGLNRFWFCSGQGAYRADEAGAFIERCPVILLTEAEKILRSGAVKQTGLSDPRAKNFSDLFSEFYSAIAEKRPVYRELENLFRCVAVARLLQEQHRDAAEALLGPLIHDFGLQSFAVPTSLPGRWSVWRNQHIQTGADGDRVLRLWMPSCGGVIVDVRPLPRESTLTERRRRKQALDARPNFQRLSWDILLEGQSDLWPVIERGPERASSMLSDNQCQGCRSRK